MLESIGKGGGPTDFGRGGEVNIGNFVYWEDGIQSKVHWNKFLKLDWELSKPLAESKLPEIVQAQHEDWEKGVERPPEKSIEMLLAQTFLSEGEKA